MILNFLDVLDIYSIDIHLLSSIALQILEIFSFVILSLNQDDKSCNTGLHSSIYWIKYPRLQKFKWFMEWKTTNKYSTWTTCISYLLYEEGLYEATIQESIKVISQADTLIIGGTSLVVYPAAGLINYFRDKNLVLINKSSTSADDRADLIIHDAIGKVLGEAVSNL